MREGGGNTEFVEKGAHPLVRRTRTERLQAFVAQQVGNQRTAIGSLMGHD
jgi:hypothetical protein